MKYNQGVIDFFKRHNMYDEKVFSYLQENSVMLDYNDPEQKDFAGCFYVQERDDTLKRLLLYIPYVYDDITTLVNIHEITHGIENYAKLGRKFKKSIMIETLPILYEKIYIRENISEELINYEKYMDNIREKSNVREYVFALKVCKDLLDKYDYNMKKMQKMTKKLSRKYRY